MKALYIVRENALVLPMESIMGTGTKLFKRVMDIWQSGIGCVQAHVNQLMTQL